MYHVNTEFNNYLRPPPISKSRININFHIGLRSIQYVVLPRWGTVLERTIHEAYLTIRLRARNFYEVIVDEGEARINYQLIEIKSE